MIYLANSVILDSSLTLSGLFLHQENGEACHLPPPFRVLILAKVHAHQEEWFRHK